ncbi:MAG: pyrroline-5-carboxylate reductase [Brevinematales bacterium]|nr:pyrroline-5-carboxylate reductase [Brevinematales bacterium]
MDLGKKVGFIGFGNMGSVLAKGIVDKGIATKDEIFVYDKEEAKILEARRVGLKTANSVVNLFENTDFVFLCVKPKDLFVSLEEIRNLKGLDIKYDNLIENKVLISILAGTKISRVRDAVGFEIPIVRVMPNTPTLVGEGAFGICFSSDIRDEDKDIILRIFGALGRCVIVSDEDLMDVITGLSGSGPAYIFVVIQALADGAVRMGLSRSDALLLAAQTVLGSAKMVIENLGSKHPEELKDMVMSPGGTTAEGIKVLEKNKVRYAFMKAVEGATKKSKELSK